MLFINSYQITTWVFQMHNNTINHNVRKLVHKQTCTNLCASVCVQRASPGNTELARV